MKRATLRLRARGQLTIPKEWLDEMGAEEGDVFVAQYEPEGRIRLTMELQKTQRVHFSDALEKYIIADMMTEGRPVEEIMRLLPERKNRLEEAYSKWIEEIEASGDFVDGTDWLRNG